MRKLEKLNPDSNGLRFLRGVVALQREQELKQAERHFKEAVKNDRQFAKAQYYLALTYFKMRRMDDARRALDKTLKMSPGHPFANALRGYISRARGL